MKQLNCTNSSCSTILLSSDEVATGLCTRCINLLQKRHAYAVVCWQCGNPTFIDLKPTKQGKPIIKDKYIMSKSCNNCNPESDGHRYMNITSEEKSKIVLGEGETLITSASGLVTSKSNKSPKLRKMDETEPSNGQSDILTKIQLDERNQKAEEFLNNLKFEESDHGE